MSQLEVDKIIPQSGTTLTIGETGDTISFASGVLPSLESLTITGDLTVDTDTFKVDSTNNLVGVGGTSTVGGGATNSQILFSIPNTNRALTIKTVSDGAEFDVGTTNTNLGKDLIFSSGGSEAMRINSSGNVGIGTSSPDGLLHLQRTSGDFADGMLILRAFNAASTTRNTLRFYNEDTEVDIGEENGRIEFYNSDNSGGNAGIVSYISSVAKDGAGAGELVFSTGAPATERMRIDSSGNVGIGTTSPSRALEVAGQIVANDNGSNDGGAVIRAWNTTSPYAMFGTTNMALGSEYAVITDGTNTYVGGGAGGSVYIRNGANDSNPQIQVGSSQINMTGVVDFSSNLVLPSNAQLTTVSGNYGNIQVDGGGTIGGYDGLNVNGHTVFMSNGSRAGIYNDTDNEWLMYGDFNGDVALYYDGAIKLQTTSTGASVTGTLSATTLSGAGVYTDGTVSASNNSNGYIRFANNLIIQWVRKSVTGTQTITLPQAMNHYYGAYDGSQTTGDATLRIHSLSTTQVVVGNRDGNITGWVLVYGRKT